MLVSDVIDRTFNEWLTPAGIDRASFDTLLSGIDASTLSIPLTGRISNIPHDSILEIDSELILVSTVSGSTVTAQERGYLETDPATHASGSRVYVTPQYPRKVLFNALNTLLGDLWTQGVYVLASTSSYTYSKSAALSMPSGCKRIVSVLQSRYTDQTRYKRFVKGRHYEVFPEFTPIKMQFLGGGVTDRAVLISYCKEVTAASSEADNLTTLGVPSALQPHLTLGLAGYLLQSREIPRVQLEEIRTLLATQGVQVGAALNVGQSLYNQYLRYVLAEAQKLRQAEEGIFEIVQ